MRYLVLVTSLCFFVSCNKDNNKTPSNTELITSSSWKYESGGIDQDRNGTIDITFESTGLLQPCTLDNTISLHSDGSGVSDEGATKCDPADPQSTPLTWSFQNNETQIDISGTGIYSGSFKIVALTTARLGLQKDTTISGFNVSMLVNLKH